MEKIEDVAKSKLIQLTDSKELVFRFMNINEFNKLISEGEFKDLEANAREITFDQFIKQCSQNWDSWIERYTNWTRPSSSPGNYKFIERNFIRILQSNRKDKEGKKRTLLEFRNWLLNFIIEVASRDGGIDTKKLWSSSSRENPSQENIIILMKKINEIESRRRRVRAEDEEYDEKTGEYKRKNEHIGKFGNLKIILNGLISDPEYLVKNEKSLREAIFTFSKIGPIGNLLFYTEHGDTPYELMLIYRNKTIRGAANTGDPEWVMIKGHIHDVLGCVAVIDSRKFCQEIRNTMIIRTQNDPESAFPIFNSKGNLFWPK